MTAERFIALLSAYGADERRWPESERMAARAFMASEPVAARAALAEADAVDALLHAAPTPRVSMALRDRVIASAAGAGLKARRHGRRWLDRLTLIFGAGWAVAACAGVAAGIIMTTHLTADAQADAVLYQSTLQGVDDSEVLG
ncbi:MAG: hypothetical protein EON85_06640 [Brevundimonas sp.]|nr:MAG: hypothetical protein EON85_06640 [Brevundimonas sp.]